MHQMPDNTLHIEKVKREDAGTYVCRAQIKGRSIYQELAVSVVVNGEQFFSDKGGTDELSVFKDVEITNGLLLLVVLYLIFSY